MEELYKHIEMRIALSGYKGSINGEEVYDDICEEIEDKEPGSYIFMCKKEDDTFFEYKIDVLEEDFNLSYLIIHTGDKDYTVSFD